MAKLDLKIMKTMISQQLVNFIQTESKVMFPRAPQDQVGETWGLEVLTLPTFLQ